MDSAETKGGVDTGKRECVRSCMRARSRESELDRAKCVCVCVKETVCVSVRRREGLRERDDQTLHSHRLPVRRVSVSV